MYNEEKLTKQELHNLAMNIVGKNWKKKAMNFGSQFTLKRSAVCRFKEKKYLL